MEREGRGGEMRKERRGRRGGEKRRGIVIGGMVIGLLLGCNNGGEDPQKVFLKSVVSLGNDFLNVFTSFGDIVGSALGFSDKTKKSDVKEYFDKIHDTVKGTKDKLNKIVADMKNDNNPNASGTEAAVNKLVNETLDKIIEGAKKVSEAIVTDTDLIVDFGKSGVGAAGNSKVVQSINEGIKIIADIVLEGKGQANAGDDKNPAEDSAAGNVRSLTSNTHHGALALFANQAIADTTPGVGKAAKDASKAVGAVTGAAILQAMAQVSGNAAKLATHDGALSSNTPIADAGAAKDATIAGGIALRAIAGGKFANRAAGSDEAAKQQVKDAAISAVTKALNTLTIAIRKTVGEGLKKVKDAMKINANDNPITSETNTAAK